jgi:hypothetical protein
MQAQQLVLLGGPAAGAARRGRRRGRPCAEPDRTPADRLRRPAQPLGHVLQRVPAGGQLCQTPVVLSAPAPGVGAQTQLACPRGHARDAAVRQLRSDLRARQRARVPVPYQRVLPCRPTAAWPRAMNAELLGVQAHSVRRAPEPIRQRHQLSALHPPAANQLVLIGQVPTRGRTDAHERAAAQADLLDRTAEARSEQRRKDTCGSTSAHERLFARRPRLRRPPRSEAERPAASDDSVGRASQPQRDLLDRKLLGRQPAKLPILRRSPAPGHRSQGGHARVSALPWSSDPTALTRLVCGSRRRSGR